MTAFEASPYMCPRCRSNGHRAPLFSRVADGIGMNGCGACGGVFLGPDCVRRLAEALPEEALALSERAARAARYHADTAPTLACPVCAREMTRVSAGRAGVDLDRCEAHGTFYDRDEIARVAAAIRASGRHGAGREASTVTVGPQRAKGAAAVHATKADGSEVIEGVVETAGDIAVTVGVEIVLEGVFAVIEGILD